MAGGVINFLTESTRSASNTTFLSHFFCQNMIDRANTASSIVKGLMYGLAHKQPDLIDVLHNKYNDPEDIRNTQIAQLWVLLKRMLALIKGFERVYLVVDALDECQEDKELITLLGLIKRDLTKESAAKVKWLVFSRRSPDLARHLGSNDERVSIDLDEEDAAKESVMKFVDCVVRSRTDWRENLKKQVLDTLKQSAERTFIYVSFIWKELYEMDSEEAVLKLLRDLQSQTHGNELYRMYDIMFRRLMVGKDRLDDPLPYRILRAVIVAFRPLSCQDLVIAAGLPEHFISDDESTRWQRMQAIIDRCGHFLIFEKGDVHLLHKSVKDYFAMPGSEGSAIFDGPQAAEHAVVAKRCMDSLFAALSFPNFSTPETLVNARIARGGRPTTHGIAYACLYWSRHVAEASLYYDDVGLLREFFQSRFLPWLEAMAHLGSISQCHRMLKEIEGALSGTELNPDTKPLYDLLYDSRRFIIRYQSIISEDPAHAYFMANLFAPKKSLARKNCQERLSLCLDASVTVDRDEDWGPELFSINVWDYEPETHGAAISFSQDGCTLNVSPTDAKHRVLKWNSANGEFASELESHEGEFDLLKGGRLFVVDQDEECIRFMDPESTRCLCKVKISFRVITKAISPNGGLVAIAFDSSLGSKQHIRLWTLETGDVQDIHPHGDIDIRRLVVSPNNNHIAVVGQSGIVEVWDIRNEICIHTEPPTPKVDNAEFSQDSRILTVYGFSCFQCLYMETQVSVCEIKSRVEAIGFFPNSHVVCVVHDSSITIVDLKVCSPLGT